jgi:hypothetical protein
MAPNPTKVISALKVLSEKKIEAVKKFLIDHPAELNTEQAARLKKLYSALEDQWDRMELKWETILTDFTGEDSEYATLEKSVSAVEVHVKRVLAAADLHVKEKATNQSPTSSAHC